MKDYEYLLLKQALVSHLRKEAFVGTAIKGAQLVSKGIGALSRGVGGVTRQALKINPAGKLGMGKQIVGQAGWGGASALTKGGPPGAASRILM